MKFLKAGGLVLISLFALACALRFFYPPVPRDIVYMKTVDSDTAAGQLVFETRLELFKTAWVQAVGLPDESAQTVEALLGYIEALQKTPQRVDVILCGSAFINQKLSGAQPVSVAVDSAHADSIIQILRQALQKNLRVLMIAPSSEVTHRMMASLTTGLETQFTTKIPTVIFSDLAVREDLESQLAPPCMGSPMAYDGQVLDLGCNILILSRRAQVEKPRLDQYLVSIEEEAADEELVAIFRPRR